MKQLTRIACALALAVGGLSSAYAGIQINGTRVIYPAAEREVTLSMINNGTSPLLLQSWVDDGDLQANPETSKAPFLLTPPMSRVDAGKGQTLRIMFTGGNPPQDRETVFWLNVLEIPTKPKATDGDSNNFLQFAIRSRIKIFYRPKGLPGNAFDAVDQVTWRVRPDGNGFIAECTNPTPYNVSIASVVAKGSTVPQTIDAKGGMCPAKGTEKLPVNGDLNAAGGKLTVDVINDFGGFESHEVAFSR
ncbi:MULTISPECIES: fimbrial biogenesis chaperone [unclassified Dyella]|uniref:fimbrial biogenesis chaperone n=1 Tax=unclassified Dyella TaxID=2634549 RepID=UPI003F93883D